MSKYARDHMTAAMSRSHELSKLQLEQRAGPRAELALPILISLGLVRYRAVLCNLSSAGAMIETKAPLVVDAKFEFCCGSICTGATVKWREGNDFGIEFSQPIADRQLSEQISRAEAAVNWREGHAVSRVGHVPF